MISMTVPNGIVAINILFTQPWVQPLDKEAGCGVLFHIACFLVVS